MILNDFKNISTLNLIIIKNQIFLARVAFFYLAWITLKHYTTKKLLSTVVALIAFSGLAIANNESKTVSNSEKLPVARKENTKTNALEEKDVWFCYEIFESSSYNGLNGVTTVTTTYHCTWYSLAAE